MSKYIDAEKIPWTDLNDGRGGVNVYVTFLEKVARMPAADVQEVRHGRWEDEVYTAGALKMYGHKCSACGAITPVSVAKYRYCPNCGASMMDEVSENASHGKKACAYIRSHLY